MIFCLGLVAPACLFFAVDNNTVAIYYKLRYAYVIGGMLVSLTCFGFVSFHLMTCYVLTYRVIFQITCAVHHIGRRSHLINETSESEIREREIEREIDKKKGDENNVPVAGMSHSCGGFAGSGQQISSHNIPNISDHFNVATT